MDSLRGCVNAALPPCSLLPPQYVGAASLLPLDCMRVCGFTSACCALLYWLPYIQGDYADQGEEVQISHYRTQAAADVRPAAAATGA